MYAIRLELGRELEDVLFQKMQQKRDAEEREAEIYRAKRAYLVRKLLKFSVHLGFLIGILIFVFADISKLGEWNELKERLAKRPEFIASNPIIDTTVVDEIRKHQEELELLKSTSYYAEETSETEGMSEEVIGKYGIVIDINNNKILASREGRTRMVPASMTKVLTVLVAAENIAEDSLEDDFTIKYLCPKTFHSFERGCRSIGDKIGLSDSLFERRSVFDFEAAL